MTMAAAEQILRPQQTLQLARHRLTGIEQADAGRHSCRNCLGHPRVMRAAEDDNIGPGCRQWRDKTIEQGQNLCTVRPLLLDRLGQARAGLRDDTQMIGVIADQALETFALQGPVVARTPITPLRVRLAAGLTPGSRATIGKLLAARIASAAAAVAVLQAMTSALAPRRASASAIRTPRSLRKVSGRSP